MSGATIGGPSVVAPTHLRRAALVYLRQSSQVQVVQHRESTARQYALVEHAAALGWPRERILVLDADLGVSGTGFTERSGFARLLADVTASRVGIVLAIDASRLARNSADWHRLLDLCAVTDTLIGDADGVYRPNSFNDRLLLSHKALISEAELHSMRLRLDGGIRNKAARGALRRRLPVGFVWSGGEIRFHPDPAVGVAIRAVFERFAALGSARRVWRALRRDGCRFPRAAGDGATIRWVEPSATAIRNVLSNPIYAGAYVYGRSRREACVGEDGRLRLRRRRLPREEWSVLICDNHRGFIDWPTWEVYQRLLSGQTRSHIAADDSALLAGLARCGRCGRPLHARRRRRRVEEYYCSGTGSGGSHRSCLSVAAAPIETAVAEVFLSGRAPTETAADPPLDWAASNATAGMRRELLSLWLDGIIVSPARAVRRVHLVLCWRGGGRSEFDLMLPPLPRPAPRTDDSTVALVRHLARHYPDSFIAAMLNREERRTSYGHRFTARHVGSLRRHWRIPSFARRSRDHHP